LKILSPRPTQVFKILTEGQLMFEWVRVGWAAKPNRSALQWHFHWTIISILHDM